MAPAFRSLSVTVSAVLYIALVSHHQRPVDGRSVYRREADSNETARQHYPPMQQQQQQPILSRISNSMSSVLSSSGLTDRLSSSSVLSTLGLGGSSYGYDDGYYEEDCCGQFDFNTFLPGFVLVAVTYLLFFLLNATVTNSTGRRRRMIADVNHKGSCRVFKQNSPSPCLI